jgi:uncharacterized membrane protein
MLGHMHTGSPSLNHAELNVASHTESAAKDVLLSRSIAIHAPSDLVWSVLVDVEHSHEWTSTIANAALIDPGPLRLGTRAVVRRSRNAPWIWAVTAFEPAHHVTWKTGMPGLWISTSAELDPIAGGTRVTFTVRYEGLIGCLVGRYVQREVRRSLDVDAVGLKQRSETLVERLAVVNGRNTFSAAPGQQTPRRTPYRDTTPV